MAKLTARQEAEAIEGFGDQLAAATRAFDSLCSRMSSAATDRINDIPNQEYLDTIAEAFRKLGDQLCREIDQADEAEDRARDNPFHPNFRRLGV